MLIYFGTFKTKCDVSDYDLFALHIVLIARSYYLMVRAFNRVYYSGYTSRLFDYILKSLEKFISIVR